MRWIRALVANVRAIFRRDAIAHEIREEMRFHIDMRAAEHRTRGLTEREAARRARRRFGNPAVMADRGYDIRGAGIMETVWQDVRYAVRQLRRERGFAFVAITTLALAMGASTALFSVIDAALLRPVPYPDADRIVSLRTSVAYKMRDGTSEVFNVVPSYDDLDRWDQSGDVFAAVGRGRVGSQMLIVESQQPERLSTSLVSPGFLEVFGVTPLLGRGIGPEDSREGAAPVVLLGHDYWQREFAGRADAIGRTLRVDGVTSMIVGVLPSWFYRGSAVWRPMPDEPLNMRALRGSGTPTYGRLLPDIAIADAAGRLTTISLAAQSDSARSRLQQVQLESIYDSTTDGYRPALRMLGGAVLGILLIACLNVAGLLLARGVARSGELGVRASIGAGRARLVRQLLTESLVLAVVSGLGGVLLAWLLLDGLVSVLPISLPDNAPPGINGTVLAASAGATLGTTLLFGLLPAARSSRARLASQLSTLGRRHRSSVSKRATQFLIAGQVALALVLLTGAGLMTRSLARAVSIDVGFDPETFVTMEVYPLDNSVNGYAAYFPALLERVRTIPGVAAAGTVDFLPLSDSAGFTDAIVDGQEHFVATKEVTPGYFEAIGLTARPGRLPAADEIAPVGVLSESAARMMFPNGGAVGRTFTLQTDPTPRTVVGVVPDIRSRNAFVVEPDRPDVYSVGVQRAADTPSSWLTVPKVVVRPGPGAPGLHAALREAATSVGPPVVVDRIRSGSDWFGDNMDRTRNPTILIGLLGTLGLVLAAVGVFGLTAYAVVHRTHEAGVRMAFGARPIDIVRQLVREAFWPVIAGTAVGFAGAWHAGRFIESFLYETAPREPATFAVVALATILVALTAAWIPARRAAKVDPVVALRAE